MTRQSFWALKMSKKSIWLKFKNFCAHQIANNRTFSLSTENGRKVHSRPKLWRFENKLWQNLGERFTQIIGDTNEQNLRFMQAQRGFVMDLGFPESRRTSPSQALGCGYEIIWKSARSESSSFSSSAVKMTVSIYHRFNISRISRISLFKWQIGILKLLGALYINSTWFVILICSRILFLIMILPSLVSTSLLN